jgi:hypothetical protein
VASSAALDVVIVSYRCLGLLRRCLASLREHPPGLPGRLGLQLADALDVVDHLALQVRLAARSAEQRKRGGRGPPR